MLRFSGAPARPFLKGKPFLYLSAFPSRQTKIRRANSEALLPAGQTASPPHTGSASLPAGQGSVISPPVRSFLPRKSAKGNTSTFPLHILPPEKMAEQRTIGKDKRQTSVFNAGAAIPCSAGAMGRRAPGGPAGSAGFQCLWLHADAHPPHEQGAGALRFVSVGAAVRADGGRPRSRGLSPAEVFGSASGWRFYDAAQCAPVLRHCHFRGSQPRLACSPRRASFREERGFRPFLSLAHVYPDAEGKIGRRGNDAPLPRGGKGALPVCRFDAVCPCGAKALQSWRA